MGTLKAVRVCSAGRRQLSQDRPSSGSGARRTCHQDELGRQVDLRLERCGDRGDEAAIGGAEERAAPDQPPVQQARHVGAQLRRQRRDE